MKPFIQLVYVNNNATERNKVFKYMLTDPYNKMNDFSKC